MEAGDLATIKTIISRSLGIDLPNLRPEMPLGSVPGGLCADRQEIVNVLVDLSDEFGFDVLPDDVDSLNTIGDIIDYVERKMAE